MRKILAIAVLAAVASVSSAQAASVHSGKLTCTVEGGFGFIIASKKALDCVYNKANGATEKYSGSMTVVGVDVGVTGKSQLTWGVSAPDGTARGALAGSYNGLGANAALGVGGGAHMLVGGKGGVSLQPLGARMHNGVNVTAGIHSMSLSYEGGKAPRHAAKAKKVSKAKHHAAKKAPAKAKKK